VTIGIVDPLEDVLPLSLLVYLIEARPGFTQVFYLGAIKEAILAVAATNRGYIPVEKQSCRSVFLQDGPGQGRFSGLPGSGNEPHLGIE
jgi:hypothetical protein